MSQQHGSNISGTVTHSTIHLYTHICCVMKTCGHIKKVYNLKLHLKCDVGVVGVWAQLFQFCFNVQTLAL